MAPLIDDANREIYREMTGEAYRRHGSLRRMARVGRTRYATSLVVALACGFEFGRSCAIEHLPLRDFILLPKSMVLATAALVAVFAGGRWATPPGFGAWFRRKAAAGYLRDLSLAGISPDAIIRAHLAARTRPLFFNGLLVCGAATAILSGFMMNGDGSRYTALFFIFAQLFLEMLLCAGLMTDVDGFRSAILGGQRFAGGMASQALGLLYFVELTGAVIFGAFVLAGLANLFESALGNPPNSGYSAVSRLFLSASGGMLPLGVAWLHTRLWVRHWMPRVVQRWDESPAIVAGCSSAADEG